MRQIALVADLHGNLPATLAVGADIRARGIADIWCLGDIVGKGPSSAETFDWAVENCALILRGNWDEGVAMRAFAKNDQYYYRQLGEKRMKALLDLPLEHHVTVSGRKMRLLHGRPVMAELLWPHSEDESAIKALFEPDFAIVGYADCHRSALRMLRDQNAMLFNTGSVGNGLGVPMAQYAILHGEPGSALAPLEVSFVTLPYDTEQAVRDAMADDDLPKRDAYIQEVTTGRYGRVPPASKGMG